MRNSDHYPTVIVGRLHGSLDLNSNFYFKVDSHNIIDIIDISDDELDSTQMKLFQKVLTSIKQEPFDDDLNRYDKNEATSNDTLDNTATSVEESDKDPTDWEQVNLSLMFFH